jgi:SAM-dependent methyltransferase
VRGIVSFNAENCVRLKENVMGELSKKDRWRDKWDNESSPRIKDYDYWFNLHIPRRQEMLDVFAFMQKALCPGPDKLLDIGSGTGAVTLNLIKNNKSVRPVLIDGSGPQLETAKKHFQAESIEAEFLKIDLNDRNWMQEIGSGFPLVVSNIMIHHLEDSRKAELFREIHDLLVPGGLFLYGDVIKWDDDESEDVAMDLWIHQIRQNYAGAGLDVGDFGSMKKKFVESNEEEGDMPATIDFITT